MRRIDNDAKAGYLLRKMYGRCRVLSSRFRFRLSDRSLLISPSQRRFLISPIFTRVNPHTPISATTSEATPVASTRESTSPDGVT